MFLEEERPSRSYTPGRTCRHRDCLTRLSIYNPDGYCHLHRHASRFKVDRFIDERPWPTHLPSPQRSPHLFHPDELVVLRLLRCGDWVNLNYVLDDGAQAANNAVRRLRRKGFTIEGRKQGGYRLDDCLPVFE